MAFSRAADLQFAKDKVAIAITHGAFGSHIGIAFHKAKEEGPHVLHLAWHQKLTVDPYPPESCWIASCVEMSPLAGKQLVGIVRAVAKRSPAINYAVNCIAPKGSFDGNGNYKPPRGSHGLTCATFVSEVFRAASLPLIKEDTWQPNESNVKWGNDVCDRLAKHNSSEEHVAAVRRSINGLRVRPEEVGAASELPVKARPAAYEAVVDSAQRVMQTLHQSCPLFPPASAETSTDPVREPAN